jgi:hypothetical protein
VTFRPIHRSVSSLPAIAEKLSAFVALQTRGFVALRK